MSTEEESLELKALEAALAALTPKTGSLDRERLMYLAGRASLLASGGARKFRWAWPAATAAMTTLAAALLAVVALRADPAPRIVERIVEVPVAPRPAAVVAGPQKGTVPFSLTRKSGQSPAREPSLPEPDRAADNARPATASYSWSLVSRLVAVPAVDGRGPSSPDNYSALRNRLLRDGASAWTEPPSRHAPAEGVAEPASYRQMLDSALEDAGATKSAPERPAAKTFIPFFGGHS